MDFDSPSCVPTTTTLRCCCCCSRLLRRCTMPYAVCLMPFLLYDYIRCSFFALISLICLCWRRLADTFVVAFGFFHFYLWHATCCRLSRLPSSSSFSLSCALSQNDFKQVRIRDAVVVVVVVVQVHSKSDYVCCVLVCVCDVPVLVSVCMHVWVCICICKIFSAAATTTATATAARRTASAEKWQTESHVAFAFNLLIALHCSLSTT